MEKLTARYHPNVQEFLHSMADPAPELCGKDYTFLKSDFALRGPWNTIEFTETANDSDAREALSKAMAALDSGSIPCFAIRLGPKTNPSIAAYLERRKADGLPALRPLRCESVLCYERDFVRVPMRERPEVSVERFSPSGPSDFIEFARCQLEGYGFQPPVARDVEALAGMYSRWNQQQPPRLSFFVARSLHANSHELLGTLTVLPDVDKRTIGFYGLAVLPTGRQRGIAQYLIDYGLEEVIAQYPALAGDWRPPLLVALSDSFRENERLLRVLGFRLAELRPLYSEPPPWEHAEEFVSKVRWPRVPHRI